MQVNLITREKFSNSTQITSEKHACSLHASVKLKLSCTVATCLYFMFLNLLWFWPLIIIEQSPSEWSCYLYSMFYEVLIPEQIKKLYGQIIRQAIWWFLLQLSNIKSIKFLIFSFLYNYHFALIKWTCVALVAQHVIYTAKEDKSDEVLSIEWGI